MQILKVSILFFWLLVLATVSSGQEPHYIHYDVEDGLPSNDVYHVIQDSKGYVWFATDNGVSRFDGNNFKNYSLDDGLPDNTIFEIYEDYKGRIWFVSFSLNLSYYYKGEIHRYKHNDKLINSFYKNRIENKLAFYVDRKDNLYIGIRRLGVIKIDTTGKIEYFDKKEEKNLNIYKIESNNITARTYKYYDKIKIHKEDSTLDLNFNIKIKPIQQIQNNDFVLQFKDKLIISHNGQVFKIWNQKVLMNKDIQENVIWMSLDKNDQLWLGTRHGILQMNPLDFSTNKRFLDQHIVTSVLDDDEGSYWFTTEGDGVYFCPDLNFLNLRKEDGLVTDQVEKVVVDSSGGTWVGYNEPYLSLYRNGDIENIELPTNEIKGVYDLKYDPYNEQLLISRNLGLIGYKDGNVSVLFNRDPKGIFLKNKDVMWVANTWGVMKYVNYEHTYYACIEDSFCMRSTSVYMDKDGVLYIGGLNGLWTYSGGKFEHMGEQFPDLYYRISDIQKLTDCLVISSRGAGIIIKHGEDYFKITEEDGLISNSINSFVVDNSTIWACSNKGVSKVVIKNNDPGNFDIINVTNKKGLPYSQVKDIAVSDSLVYVATREGLAFFPKNAVKKNLTSPPIYIESVNIHGEDTTVRSEYDLKHNENYLTINYIGLSYRNQGNVSYKYRLTGMDTTWNYTKRNTISFSNLPPGRYQYTVLAKNEDGIWSKNPASINLTIRRPFWETWWFIGLGVLLVASIIFVIVFFRLRVIRKRNELMQDINEYKQKILRQQMNPHFIFNTLNSIQYFLLDEDTTSSLTYLTKFAKMMRIILDNSQHTFVPIEDEVRGLDLYLELEALRYEDSFDYQINIDKEINTFEYKVPALLLQPYVENSIRHGLLHKKEKGFLEISVQKHENSLFCFIEDNGIGREKAEEIKMSKGPLKKSLGSKITEDRINVLNSLYSDEIDVNYVDLCDSEGNSTGTRVEIRLPFIY